MEASANAASIDLKLRHFMFHRAEITMIGTWLNVNGKTRPGIALIRRGEDYFELCRPYTIGLDVAHVWSEKVGDDAESTRQCFDICDALRLDLTDHNVTKVKSFVRDKLGDLVSMPPFPPSAAPAREIAEVTVRNRATGEEHEVVLKDV